VVSNDGERITNRPLRIRIFGDGLRSKCFSTIMKH
jgi:hypothetical protein